MDIEIAHPRFTNKVNLLQTMKRLKIIDFDKILLTYTPFYGRDMGEMSVEWL